MDRTDRIGTTPEPGGPAAPAAGPADPAAPGAAAAGPVVNAMSVDVEDYFQVQAFAGVLGRDSWDAWPSRVEANTETLLALYRDCGVRATFYILGWVAERFPRLVERIAAEGHEVASHGWCHIQVFTQTPDEFRADVRRTKRLLEDVSGRPVIGYRAATYSIDGRNLWAHRVLKEEGYRYSSSIYPIRHDLYGMPEAPRFAFEPIGAEGVVELPVSTVETGARRLPCGGGGYFRLLPYALSRRAIARVNKRDEQPCIFYLHPWEVDPGQPRIPGIGAKSRFRHYLNLARMLPRLRALLGDFAWDRMDRVFAREIFGPEALGADRGAA
jgi:polysaccharide deacetylase family protein (PEP-CTERM system associated)